MKLLIFLILLTIASDSMQTVFVSRVVDGDTFKDSTNQSYRLIGINAPESNEKGGYEATQFLDSLISNRQIKIVTDIKYDTIDFYKRKLCYVYLNGMDINKLMIQAGHAIAYTKYPFARAEEYLAAQNKIITKPAVDFTSTTSQNTDTKNYISLKKIKTYALVSSVIVLIIIAIYFFYKK